MGWKLRGQVPRQELANTVYRIIGDAFKEMSQIEFRIEIVELGRAEQAVLSASRSPPESEPAKK